MAGLYLHIPFCKQACHYCDFHFSTGQQFRAELITAMTKELEWQKHYLNDEPVSTIYFGGGTPSLLLPSELEHLLSVIHQYFPIDPAAEVSLEANPDDLTDRKLADLYQLGFNRLSIGIQSFDDSILQFLNRAHNSSEAIRCVDAARTAGFSNISIDLMYALPGQDQKAWQTNILKALELQPEHISAYSLTIERKTAFGHWQKTGKLEAVSEEASAEQFELLMDMLQTAGFEHYEISNFCRPGFYSRHNSSYWEQEKYLGIGPSAHSYDRASRQYNVSNNPQYVKSIDQRLIPFEREVLTRENKINEYVFTSLRTSKGCHLHVLQDQWEFDFLKNNKDYISGLLDQQLATLDDRVLKLTRRGKLLADRIASDLFIEAGID